VIEQSRDVTIAEYVAVSQVVSLYGHLFDAKKWDELDRVFHNDCVVDYRDSGRDRVVGLDSLREHMRNNPPTVISHMTTNLYVWREDDLLKARSKLIAPLPDGTTLSGVYEDVLCETRFGWRVAERVVRLRRSVEDTF
jgi:3-phenylpropionate/cinnamic acid dioxygenase small subunit